MLITEKLSISNTKRFLSNQNLFEILYYTFLKEINNLERKGKKLFDNKQNELAYSLKEAGNTEFNKGRTIIVCNMIFDFLDWKPYVKTFNYIATANFIIKKCRAIWDQFRYTKKQLVFDTTDHKIRVLYGLWEKGLYFQDYEHTPKSIRKLMSLELYGPYFLQKLFDKDFREGKMQYFSTNKKESEPYYSRYYYQKELNRYDDIRINTNDYVQPQDQHVLYTQFAVNIDITGSSGIASTTATADYEAYLPTSTNSDAIYHSQSGGTVTWS